jgi:hypothetical protein
MILKEPTPKGTFPDGAMIAAGIPAFIVMAQFKIGIGA